MSDLFAECISGGLSSGLHKYAGDPNKLRLRLIFTDHNLLAARPSVQAALPAAATSSTNQQRSRKQKQKQRTDINNDPPPFPCHSSFLLARHHERWTIAPERGSLFAEFGGLELRVVSERLSGELSRTSSCKFHRMERDARIASTAPSDGQDISSPTRSPTQSTFTRRQGGEAHSHAPAVGSTGTSRFALLANKIDELTTRQPAFYWKNTATVTSENNWQRTLARKLPYEMRNHRQDYHLNKQQQCQRWQHGETMSRNLANFSRRCWRCNSNLTSTTLRSLACLDCGAEIGRAGGVVGGDDGEEGAKNNWQRQQQRQRFGNEEESCDITDWYQRWLLNRRRNLSLSSATQEAAAACLGTSVADTGAGAINSSSELHLFASSQEEEEAEGGLADDRFKAQANGSDLWLGHQQLPTTNPKICDNNVNVEERSVGDLGPVSIANIGADNFGDEDDDVGKDGGGGVSDATSPAHALGATFVASGAASGAVIAAADKINKDQKLPTQTAAAATKTTCSCSHGEILYILLVTDGTTSDSQQQTGESFIEQQQISTSASDRRFLGAAGSSPTRAGDDRDATVLTGQTNGEIDKEEAGAAGDIDRESKIQKRSNKSAKSRERQQSDRSSDVPTSDDNEDENSTEDNHNDQLGNNGMTIGERKKKNALPDDDDDDDGESIGEREELEEKKKISNQTTASAAVIQRQPQWLGEEATTMTQNEKRIQQEHRQLPLGSFTAELRRIEHQKQQQQGYRLSKDSKVACLAVIVIDVLNRFIQLKPDLSKLISLDNCARLGLYSIGSHALAAHRAANESAINSNVHQRQRQKLQLQQLDSDNPNTTSNGSSSVCVRQLGDAVLAGGQLQPVAQSQLLYSLELVGDQADEIAEAERELNLVHENLLSRPATSLGALTPTLPHQHDHPHSRPARDQMAQTTGGFLSPVDGSVLIKLQFDIHFASHFAEDCRNLYVKYKVLAAKSCSKVANGSVSGSNFHWKLRRLKQVYLKEEILACSTKAASGVADRNDGEDNDYEDLDDSYSSFEEDDATDLATTTTHAATANDDGLSQKLAQLTHLSVTAAHNAAAATANTANMISAHKSAASLRSKSQILSDDDLLGKPSSCESSLVDNRNQQQQQVDTGKAATVRRRRLATSSHDTCLLEGSTITSWPNSRGQFHFACVEELVLELGRVEQTNNKWPASSSSLSPAPSSVATTAASKTPVTSGKRQKSSELASSGTSRCNVNRNTDNVATVPTDVATDSSKKLQTDDDDDDDKDRRRSATNQATFGYDDDDRLRTGSANPPAHSASASSAATNSLSETASAKSRSQVTNHNGGLLDNNRTPTIGHPNQTGAGGGRGRTEIAAVDARRLSSALEENNYGGEEQTAAERQQQLRLLKSTRRGVQSSNDNSSNCPQQANNDEVLEIVILLELYSSDYYRDRLQGWSHLSVPVCLARDMHHPSTWNGCARSQQRFLQTDAATRYELPVILPELRTPIDKLRYYLTGQLPKSLPSLESFARNKHRYMLQTRQSGKLVLDCVVARQFSDPNFDIALRDLLTIGKQAAQQKRKWQRSDKVGLRATERHLGGLREEHDEGSANQFSDTTCNHDDASTSTSAAIASRSDQDGVQPMAANEDDEMDTERVVEAYRRAKLRIDKLNMMNSTLLPTTAN